MKKFSAKTISPGMALGKVNIISHKERVIERIDLEFFDEVSEEKERFLKACVDALKTLEFDRDKAALTDNKEAVDIFEAQMMILSDAGIHDAVLMYIEEERVNAEYALKVKTDALIERFLSFDDEAMRERAIDIKDVAERLFDALLEGKKEAAGDSKDDADIIEKENGSEMSVICASDITPGEIMALDRDKIDGFVLSKGSALSHAAIIIKGMGVPALIEAGEDFLKVADEADGKQIIVNADDGSIIIDPDKDELDKQTKIIEEKEKQSEDLKKLIDEKTVTKSGKKIGLFANIGSSEEAVLAKESGAEGIGLFRTEFIFMNKNDAPSEEEQFEIYKDILGIMKDKPVIIRTLDAGADKDIPYLEQKNEENPALGLRGIRLMFKYEDILRTQLRALYRASVYGDLGIMFPMISTKEEVERLNKICEEVKEDLKKEGAETANVNVGIMIETPAAALISDELAKMVSFFSIGTNDLTQYALGADRLNPDLASYTRANEEAILKLVEMSAKSAKDNGIKVGICGEMASDKMLAKTFIDMGIDDLSVSSNMILPFREYIRSLE